MNRLQRTSYFVSQLLVFNLKINQRLLYHLPKAKGFLIIKVSWHMFLSTLSNQICIKCSLHSLTKRLSEYPQLDYHDTTKAGPSGILQPVKCMVGLSCHLWTPAKQLSYRKVNSEHWNQSLNTDKIVKM